MNEQEIKNLLSVYQQKVNDLTAQNIALESRILNLSQLVEPLTNKINELTEENQKLKSSKSRKTSVKEDSGEF
jgi:predicted RNase H-like nuclease (RuvC/YqgF family)